MIKIKLLNKNKKVIAFLKGYKNLNIESDLESGDKTLSFSYPKFAKFYEAIEEEGYIRTKTDEFVIKAEEGQDDESTFTCTLNVEDLEGNPFDRFESKEQRIEAALNLALVNTGWTIGNCDIKKKRTVRMSNASSWEIIQEIKKTYRVEMQFDTLNKKINIYEHIGSDKGAYFIDSLNLTALGSQSNSYDYATRIKAIGKDGLTFASINNGKDYVENYQYSNKIKTIYWKDERYTIPESLKEDAEAKLYEISKPYRAYSASIINLAEMNDKYKNILDYKLGDTITLISKNNKIKEKQRIVKIVEYPDDHSRDTVELANTILKFEDIQKQFQDAADTVDNITTDNGTVDGDSVDGIKAEKIENLEAEVLKVTNFKAIVADIVNLKAGKADIQSLNSIEAKIGTLNTTKANITELNTLKAVIQEIKVGKADINDLKAATAKILILEAKAASFDNALAGNLTARNFQANAITAGSGIIADGAIGSAQISDLDVNKLNAGALDTSKIQILGPNGRFRIIGNKLQVLDDKNGKLFERIMLGVDDNNKSTLALRGKDGQTTLIDENGLTDAGFTNGYGKVNDNSLDASKFDKNSIVRQVNGSTETIKGTKVQIGDRTLDVELSTQKNSIIDHGKEISTQKAIIQALDDQVKLKVDTQTFKESTNSINTSINNAKNSAVTEANKHSDTLATKLKSDAEKYANDVAIAKSELAKQQAIANADGKISAEEQKRIDEAKKNLATAISKANAAESNARNYANQVAEQKKQDAIKNANAYTTAQITTTNSNLSKATSEIDVLKGQIGTKVGQTDIDKSISEIKFSDVNIILNSGNFKDLSHWSITNGSQNLFVENNYLVAKFKNFADWGCYVTNDSLRNIPLDTSKKYTVLCKLKASRKQNVGFNICDGNSYNYVFGKDLNLTTEWQLFKFTFQPSQKGNERQFRFITSKVEDFDLYIEFVKMVVGSTSSDSWTSAPEDINQAIIDSAKKTDEKIKTVQTELKQTKESFGVSVRDLNSKTSTIETNITNTTKTLDTKINAAKTEAINSARNEINSAKAYAEKVAKDNSNLAKQQAINDSKSYVNGQIGAVNTNINNVKNTTDLLSKGLNKWIFKAFDKTGIADAIPNIGMIIGKNLIWSKEISDADMNSSKNFRDNYLGYCKTNVYLEHDFNWNTTLRTDDGGAIYLNGALITTTVSCTPKNLTMNFKEGWNTVEVLWIEGGGADGFNFGTNLSALKEIKIMNAYNVADSKADVGYLSNDITNKYNSSVSHANNIAEQKKNEAITGARNIPDTRSTNENPQWYMQNYPRQTITEFKFSNTVGISASGNPYGSLETKVPWGDASGGYPVQTFRSNSTATYQRHGTSNTTWSAWEQIEDTNGSQSKANNALNNAKTYTNTQINTVNSRVSNAESSINILKNQISTKVSQSDIDRTVNNIKFGGRNLLLNTALTDNSSHWTFDKGTSRSSNVDNALGLINHSIFYDISGLNDDAWRAANPETVPCIEGDIVSAQVMIIVPASDHRLDTQLNQCSLEIQFFDNNFRRIKTECGNVINSNFPKDKWVKVVCENRIVPPGATKMNARVWARRNARLWIGNLKLEKSTKCSDWTAAAEDFNQKIQDNIQTVTQKITNTESTLTQKTNNINAAVNSVQNILKTKADGSTVSSMQSQVSSLNIGLNGIKTEVNKKTDKGSIISEINQSSENIKIRANKIDLEGTTTVRDGSGRFIQIDKGDYSVFKNNNKVAYFGFDTDLTGDIHPKLTMGADGIKSNNDYFTLNVNPRGGGVQEKNMSYADIAYKCSEKMNGDYSNIKMYGDGSIRLAPLRQLDIVTAYSKGVYKTGWEKLGARFDSSNDPNFDYNLQIDCVRNMNAGRGLILGDFHLGNGKATCVRVQTDDGGTHYFRPLNQNGDIQLGSESFRWYRLYSKYATSVSSHRHLKTNIIKFNDLQAYNNLKNINIYTFNLKKFDENRNVIGYDNELCLGTMIDELPIECCDTGNTNFEKKGVDMYGFTSYIASALKVAINKIENLEKEIELLKQCNKANIKDFK